MRIAKEDIDVKMEIPGAVIRQQTEFGDSTGLGTISGEYFGLSADVDTTQLFQGLEAEVTCASAHTGASSCAGNSRQRARTAHRKLSKRMISFTGHPGTM